MSPQDAISLIANGEGLTVEFKEQLSSKKPEQICKEVAALASMQGGQLFIGVRDDGFVCGVDDPRKIQNQLESLISAYVEPVPAVEVRVLRINERDVVCVDVKSGMPPIYFFDGKPYWRVGTASMPAGPTEVERLIRNSEVTLELRRLGTQIASMNPAHNVSAAITGQGELATMNYEQLRVRLIGDLSKVFVRQDQK